MGFSGLTFFLIFIIISLVKGLSGIRRSTPPFNRTNGLTTHKLNDPKKSNKPDEPDESFHYPWHLDWHLISTPPQHP